MSAKARDWQMMASFETLLDDDTKPSERSLLRRASEDQNDTYPECEGQVLNTRHSQECWHRNSRRGVLGQVIMASGNAPARQTVCGKAWGESETISCRGSLTDSVSTLSIWQVTVSSLRKDRNWSICGVQELTIWNWLVPSTWCSWTFLPNFL